MRKSCMLYTKKRIVGGRVIFTLEKPTTGGRIRMRRIKRNGKTYMIPVDGSTSISGSSEYKTGSGSRKASKSSAQSILKSLSKRGGTLGRYV